MTSNATVSTGIPGLDSILGGGLPSEHVYLVVGNPGAGKTTLALQFALEGARQGEPVLYVTLAETRDELHQIAASHGWSLDGVSICELPPPRASVPLEQHYTLFHPAEVELDTSLKHLLQQIDELGPRRVVLDSMAGLAMLADDPARHRQQIQALRQLLIRRHCTTLLLDEAQGEVALSQVVSLVHGVVLLERHLPEYGRARRRLSVAKMRGMAYPDSYHDFRIDRGGLRVFPRLIAAEHEREIPEERVSSGDAALDALLGGGLSRGYSALILGPAGCGKSTLTAQFAVTQARRGERCVVYLFDEARRSYVNRIQALGLPIQEVLDSGHLEVQRIDPGGVSPGELANIIIEQVEGQEARLVVIDSLSGYFHAIPEERFIHQHVHELLVYLNHCGVITLVTSAQRGLLRAEPRPQVELSTLVDTVLLLRYFEFQGQVGKAISVIKHRGGVHETAIRELHLNGGLRVGSALYHMQGVLTGHPRYGDFGNPSPEGDE